MSTLKHAQENAAEENEAFKVTPVTEEQAKAAKKKLMRARSQMILKQPFFGTLVMRLALKENQEMPTMAVDGINMFYSPHFVNKITEFELIGVLSHETLHCAFHHMTRIGNRNPKLWNVACDYAINQIVKDSGLMLPSPHLDDPKYHDMTADNIYTALLEDFKSVEELVKQLAKAGLVDGNGDDIGGCGGVLPAPKPGSDSGALDAEGNPIPTPSKEELENEWKQATVAAARNAKGRGDMPGSLSKLVKSITNPKVNWKATLARFFQTMKSGDFSWKRLNRRFIAEDLYLPSIYSERLGNVVIAIDTSGSVSEKELEAFVSEISSLLSTCNPEQIHVLQCDTSINDYSVYTPEDLPLSIERKGFGGTRFEPVFERVEKLNIKPVALLYLTDLEAYTNFKPPEYPVLWVTTRSEDADFGEVVKLDL